MLTDTDLFGLWGANGEHTVALPHRSSSKNIVLLLPVSALFFFCPAQLDPFSIFVTFIADICVDFAGSIHVTTGRTRRITPIPAYSATLY